MSPDKMETIKTDIQQLVAQSGYTVLPSEWEHLMILDFGLGDFSQEGLAYIDLVATKILRVALLILLPMQTLPQHSHPTYDGCSGKEETIRVLHGETKVYVPGKVNNREMIIPSGKAQNYTARHEIRLQAGEQYTIKPNTPHWFQSGEEGSVSLTFQNRVDESKNVFAAQGASAHHIPR